MTRLILKLFVSDKPRTEAQRRTRLGTVGGAVGIAVNVLLAIGKAAAGLLFGSIALVADAVNNVTDAAGSIITLVGFKLAASPPDEDHPYGHGRMEYLSGMLLSFVVLLLGLSLLKSSVTQIFSPKELIFSYISIGVMIVSILGKLWLSLFYTKLQKLTCSATFSAAAADSRGDMLSTFGILVSLIVFKLTGLNLDGVMGLVVSVLIIINGIGLIRETLDPLLGKPPESELIDQIHSRAMSYDGIIGIHDLILHDYGPGRRFLSFHAEVPAAVDIMKSHDLVDNVERDFKKEMGLDTVIHIDPVVTDDPVLDELKETLRSILHHIDPAFTFHDFRAVVGPTHTNLIFDVVLPTECNRSEKEITACINETLHETHPHCFAVITYDRSFI